MSDLTTANLKQLLDQATPGPWEESSMYSDGEPRADSSREIISAAGKYMGIMHEPDVRLATLAPELAEEVLRMRSELDAMRRAWLSVVNDLQRMTIEKDLAAQVLVHIDSILGETND